MDFFDFCSLAAIVVACAFIGLCVAAAIYTTILTHAAPCQRFKNWTADSIPARCLNTYKGN